MIELNPDIKFRVFIRRDKTGEFTVYECYSRNPEHKILASHPSFPVYKVHNVCQSTEYGWNEVTFVFVSPNSPIDSHWIIQKNVRGDSLPADVGFAHNEREASEKLYQCAKDIAAQISCKNSKHFLREVLIVDETQRAGEGQLAQIAS